VYVVGLIVEHKQVGMLSQSTFEVHAGQGLSLDYVWAEGFVKYIGWFSLFLFVQLLDVGQVEGAEGVGCSDLTLVDQL